MSFIDYFGKKIKPMFVRGVGWLNPQETGWINDRIAAVKQDDVNFWFVKCGKEIVVFDTGYVDYEGAKETIKQLGIDEDSVKYVFLTHADIDHAGGLVSEDPLFKNAKVYIHKDEEAMLTDKVWRFRFGPIKIKNSILYKGEYTLLNSGEIIKIGDSVVEIIHIPGHTNGHSGYIVDGKILVTGDCMAINYDGGHCFFPICNMDTDKNLESLKELRARFENEDIEIVLTGHNGFYEGSQTFANVEEIAKGTKKQPFDPTAPNDLFAKE